MGCGIEKGRRETAVVSVGSADKDHRAMASAWPTRIAERPRGLNVVNEHLAPPRDVYLDFH